MKLFQARDTLPTVMVKTGSTVLHTAAQHGSARMVEVLLEHGAGVNATDHEIHWTALHIAADYGTANVVHVLLEHGATVNTRSQQTALHFATSTHTDAADKVLLLLANSADPSAVDEICDLVATNDYTALHHAVGYGRAKTVEALCEYGCDLSAITPDGWTAFQMALRTAEGAMLETFVKHGADVMVYDVLKHGADPNASTDDGSTALLLASSRDWDCDSKVDVLLEYGVNVDVSTEEGYNAVYLAATFRAVGALKKLLDHGVNAGAAANDGSTALHIAAEKGNNEALELLLEHGVDVNAVDRDGRTALHLPMLAEIIRSTYGVGFAPTAKLLVNHGVDVHVADVNGCTALHYAAKCNDGDMIATLLEHGAAVNAVTNEGSTPLLYAAFCSPWIAQDLLAYDADVTAVNKDGFTALHFAVQQSNDVLVKALLERGADMHAKNAAGRTPLDLCAKRDLHSYYVKDTLTIVYALMSRWASLGSTWEMQASVSEEEEQESFKVVLACANHWSEEQSRGKSPLTCVPSEILVGGLAATQAYLEEMSVLG